MLAGLTESVFRHAERVAGGFRPPMPDSWPPEVRALIGDCWAQDPCKRPSFGKVLQRLQGMQADGVDARWDARDRLQGRRCGCACFGA
jgi:Protein tyrosine and serine/threonine kinase